MSARIDNHYATLGISRQASASEIRSAYLQLARRLHPDRHVESPADERERAERVMRRVNEAWAVLRDPARKAEYDRRLTAASPRSSSNGAARTGSGSGARHSRPAGTTSPPSPPRTSATEGYVYSGPLSEPDEGGPPPTGAASAWLWIARLAPLLLIGGVLAFIFVITAFARGGSPNDPVRPVGAVGQCVTFPVSELSIPQLVDCADPHDGVVVAEVSAFGGCDPATVPFAFGDRVLCVQATSGAGP